MSRYAVWPGRAYPLGATFDGHGVNFAVYSANADRVDLCLFDAAGRRQTDVIPLPEYTDEIWHGYLPEARPGLLYGFRAYGPYEPRRGHRFNPHKLLLDPYAKALMGHVRWSDSLFGYRVGSGRDDLSVDRRDSASGMPKCVVVDDSFTWDGDRPPRRSWSDLVVYEAHVKGMTALRPDVPEHLRGTYSGLSSLPVIEHLQKLGVTAVELLPVHAFVDDRRLRQDGLYNYWGYNTIGFFAPEPRYLAGSAVHEFKTMVRRLHAAGIEVILDVVYNHTAEGNHLGPTLSFKGLDNANYYRLGPDDLRYYMDVTGTGNSLNIAHAPVLRMVMDSLRYWVQNYHVDGFRFDLATTLGRESDHRFDPGSSFFDAIRQDPVLQGVKLIAEPWDVGFEGYRLGGHGPGWAEWNDRFRDSVRAFWLGEEQLAPEVATRMLGSSDLFNHQGRRPWASVNFVTAHDGFTLEDLVSYNRKHNEANGEGNRDGHGHNLSHNFGVEGPSDDPGIRAMRDKHKRNLIATLFLSQGTPMMLMGDEIGRTQNGNNNAYCQDNETSWVDWEHRDGSAESFHRFVQRMIALRREHPVFRRSYFLHGIERAADGLPDVTWVTPAGVRVRDEDWHNGHLGAFGMLLSGAAGDHVDEMGRPLADATFLVAMNARNEDVDWTLPKFVEGLWSRLIDTADPEGLPVEGGEPSGTTVTVAGGSLALFELSADHHVRGGWEGMPTPFGSHLSAHGGTTFRLWAPSLDQVQLVIEEVPTPRVIDMERQRDGWFSTFVRDAGAGTAYRYALADPQILVPDPASAAQAGDVHGPSLVVDHSAYQWRHGDWKGRPWEETVLLELHVGSFTEEGTFAALAGKLEEIAEAGFTAIELMPVADFPGRRGWGYDGTLFYAPKRAYGSPDDLKALIDEAHGLGLMVFLDVVYNHFGPDGNYLGLYAKDFFRDDVHTPWGVAIDYRRPEVREFVICNAIYWLDVYRFDGLRLDAVHAIVDEGERHLLTELSARVRERFGPDRHVHLVLENDDNASRFLQRGADRQPYDAQWNDDFHHVMHVLLTEESNGYYADYSEKPAEKLARSLAQGFVYQGEPSPYRDGARRGEPSRDLPAQAFVNFIQNHDQIGNRAFGERLTALAPADAVKAAQSLLLLAPPIPLLYMGESYGAEHPFLFFCDYSGDLADAVREGRRREFASFGGFKDPEAREKIPDPNAEETFERSRPEAPDSEEAKAWAARTREILALRRQAVVPLLKAGVTGTAARAVGDRGVEAEWRFAGGSTLRVAAQLGPSSGSGFRLPEGRALHLSAPDLDKALGHGGLPAWSVAWFLERP
ncbi:glycogen debranching protein GlgX [Lutibaculum baratangense]|uniref:Malto-oligosyltrehalose trehalohydrolase n=1 Tax=Lutibaculum baratangense AMV1 TaxID=631454 RepID=V4R8T3_9HYPH|nr:glycogen debranching protein GlgX [Lutibaculum baratangense]ESR22591.1 Glycogen debranching enzyme [Lutibaculum baratangense AMV1]